LKLHTTTIFIAGTAPGEDNDTTRSDTIRRVVELGLKAKQK